MMSELDDISMEEETQDVPNISPYPAVFDRAKAVIADSVVIIAFMIGFTMIFSKMESVPDEARMVAFLFIFFLYDPLFTAFAGGTIGHRMNGLRVKQLVDETKNIPIYFALLRFIVKVTLGWLSLLTIMGNDKRRAVHDHLSRSVVIYADQ